MRFKFPCFWFTDETLTAADDARTLGSGKLIKGCGRHIGSFISSVLVVHVLPRHESNTMPMAIPPSKSTSFDVYAAKLFQHLDPMAIIFAPCVTERLRRLTGPLTAKSAPAGAISNVGGLA